MNKIYEAYIDAQTVVPVSMLIESNFDKKDSDRIIGILSKSEGDMKKAEKKAAQMAKSITDPAKAERRYQAAKALLGDSHPVTVAFYKSLDAKDVAVAAGKTDKKKNTLGKLGSKSSRRGEGRIFKPYGRMSGSPILPLGSVTFKNGNCKMFNVVDTWGGENGTTAELWKTTEGKYRVIFTSGDGPIYKIGSDASFQHDQNFRRLFDGKLIDWVNIGDLELLEKYKKSALGYVYK